MKKFVPYLPLAFPLLVLIWGSYWFFESYNEDVPTETENISYDPTERKSMDSDNSGSEESPTIVSSDNTNNSNSISNQMDLAIKNFDNKLIDMNKRLIDEKVNNQAVNGGVRMQLRIERIYLNRYNTILNEINSFELVYKENLNSSQQEYIKLLQSKINSENGYMELLKAEIRMDESTIEFENR